MHESSKDPTQAHPYYSHARATTRVISSFLKLFLSNVGNFSTFSLQLKKTNVSWLQKDTWFSIYFLIKNKTKKSRRAIHGHNVNDGASNFKWQHISQKPKTAPHVALPLAESDSSVTDFLLGFRLISQRPYPNVTRACASSLVSTVLCGLIWLSEGTWRGVS